MVQSLPARILTGLFRRGIFTKTISLKYGKQGFSYSKTETGQKPEDVKKLKVILDDIHESFKAMVSERRKGKLKAPDKQLFDGSFWTGRKALELGLIDGLGHARSQLKARFGDKVEIRDVTAPKSFGQRWLGLGAMQAGRHALATEFGDAALTALEQRALWARFGL